MQWHIYRQWKGNWLLNELGSCTSLMSDATNTDEHSYLMVNSCAFWCVQKPLAFTYTYVGSLGIHFDVWHFVYILYFTWTAVAFNSILLYVTHILASYTVVSGFLSRLRIAHCNQSINHMKCGSRVLHDFWWHMAHENPPSSSACNHVIDWSAQCTIAIRTANQSQNHCICSAYSKHTQSGLAMNIITMYIWMGSCRLDM